MAATNRDLQATVREGSFRNDLFYRLNVIHLQLPPLRERRQDIALLANHFLQKFSAENQRDMIEIDPAAMSLLNAWPWPGNIRELSNVIERAVVMSTGAVIFAASAGPAAPAHRRRRWRQKRPARRAQSERGDQARGAAHHQRSA
ncbi:Transcriptional regulatory protein ZraR [Edwardsiella tarda]|nr:Transcriptional regulatory protein ZraR [Edwardsiella tarda]